ncbi:MAG: ImmA/IrrE family metallo-endopeptidase [Lachnospiraceae bacterium]|nr:ImmA/IrrE family metallo-endopeptidase [Lachnospiraceae bacterium]
MGDILDESLFSKQPKRFDETNQKAKSFVVNFCGSTIIRGSIFEVVTNYARVKELPLEILRYPFKDEELWAFTFVKKGTVFLCVNSELSLCKQFFATAHELYHIYCYAEDLNVDTITKGSLLNSKTVDDRADSQEDLEANAFAGLLLMPDAMLDEQIRIYGIAREQITVDDVLTLMELFALPYKATVLRLVENGIIDVTRARNLLNEDKCYVEERMELTGKANVWQQDSRDLSYFGSLLDDMEYNKENDLLTTGRESSDTELLESIRKGFQSEG